MKSAASALTGGLPRHLDARIPPVRAPATLGGTILIPSASIYDVRVKLAFSTNAYSKFPLIEAMRGIAAAGYGAVEILADVPHTYPRNITPAQVEEIRDELERLELDVSNVNANCTFGYWWDAPPEAFFEPSLLSPNPKHRADRIELICKTLDFARAIGAANISITSGKMLGGVPPQLAGKRLAESLAPVLDHADRVGVNVGIECEPGLFLEWATELREWIDRLAHPRLGANLDIGHSQVIGEPIAETIKLLGNRIWNMHIEDIPGRKHYHLVPGEGTLDWQALKSALREINYRRWLTVELYTYGDAPQEAAEKSMAFLKKVMGE